MGSEMCIRDRCRPRCLAFAADREPRGVALVPGPSRARNRSRRSPCLLYTSDAADERSSVDLGGRRIIKEKNVIGLARNSDQ